jgi:hypothetical protein
MGDIGCYLAIVVLGVSATFLFPRWQGEVVNSSETRLCDSCDTGV